MIFKNISILTENMEIKENVDVVISENRIKSIKESQNEDSLKEQSTESEEIISGENLLMMPGFFNAHGHSPMSIMRGYGENMTLNDWLFDKIFPFEDCLTSDAVYYSTLCSMAESFKYGIVSTSDMYFFVDDMVRAVKDSGGKANISRSLANPLGVPFDELHSVSEMKSVFSKYHGTEEGRILIDASIHAEYTSNEETVMGLAEYAKENNMIMHVHVSETESEHEGCKERHNGRTPTKYFYDAGLFDVPTIAAHCVWAEEKDLELLLEKNVTIATAPVSNLKLASGIFDLKRAMDKGIRIALGTDSASSNNNLNMFEEMKTAMLLAKIKNMDPSLITPPEILMMATRNGAVAQGRYDSGYIKEGYKADVILIRTNSPNMQPHHSLINNLVWSATDSDIYMTIIDGRIVYREGVYPTIDIDEVIEGLNKSYNDIISRL